MVWIFDPWYRNYTHCFFVSVGFENCKVSYSGGNPVPASYVAGFGILFFGGIRLCP